MVLTWLILDDEEQEETKIKICLSIMENSALCFWTVQTM